MIFRPEYNRNTLCLHICLGKLKIIYINTYDVINILLAK